MIYEAHRGYSGRYPENTRIAFQKAVENGFEGVEFDVHLTKDNIPVIIHDETVDRTTNNMFSGRICDFTLAELRQMDFKWKFDVEKQTIMTLEEFAIEFGKKFKLINMELKTDEIHYENIERIAYNVIKNYQHKGTEWIMSSFNLECCRIWAKLNTGIKAAFLYNFIFQFAKIKGEENIFGYFHPSASVLLRLPEETIKWNKQCNVWTANQKDVYDNLMNFSKQHKGIIHSIITNYKVWEGEFGPVQFLNEKHLKLEKESIEIEKKYIDSLKK